MIKKIRNWLSVHDRYRHFWGGALLSISLLILFEIIGINGGLEGYLFNVGTTFILAMQWEIWRAVNLSIWKKFGWEPSEPDWNDVVATMLIAWIVPLVNFSYAYKIE